MSSSNPPVTPAVRVDDRRAWLCLCARSPAKSETAVTSEPGAGLFIGE
jgi:hypothetical protein